MTAGGPVFPQHLLRMTSGRFRRWRRMWAKSGVLRPWALILARSPGARTYAGGGGVSYTQGQSPEPRTREYFYYVDHQGQVGGGGVFTVRHPGLPGRAGKHWDARLWPQRVRPPADNVRLVAAPCGLCIPPSCVPRRRA